MVSGEWVVSWLLTLLEKQLNIVLVKDASGINEGYSAYSVFAYSISFQAAASFLIARQCQRISMVKRVRSMVLCFALLTTGSTHSFQWREQFCKILKLSTYE
jgi:hypothetical protein